MLANDIRANQGLLSRKLFTNTNPCNNPVRDVLLFLVANCMDLLVPPVPTPSGVPSRSTEAVQLKWHFPHALAGIILDAISVLSLVLSQNLD